MALARSRANVRSDQRDNRFLFNLNRDGAVSRDLGPGIDRVDIRTGSEIDQIRITFTSSEVGNGSATEGGAVAGQDGGLAVRIQAEDASGGVTGAVSRFDDEGVIFTTRGDATFDVRDISGTQRGDFFDVVALGTDGGDTFNFSRTGESVYINGGGGNDTLTGGVSSDFLVGGGGNDMLNGGGGNDRFIGGGGNDTMTGGTGADTFIFTGAPGTDTITDFVSGTDKIDFSAYGITSANVTITTAGGNTMLSVDSNKDGTADFQIILTGVGAPAPGDYIL